MDVQAYIKQLTLEEKAALLQGKTNWRTWDIPRLGIPGIFLADGPHGLRRQVGSETFAGFLPSEPATCFPTAAAMANSWDEELGEELGRALGAEARNCDVQVLLGPGLNIKRSPLCGRNFEYFSEDPHLSGKMAAAYIRGIEAMGVAACPKHFAANSQETWRMTTDSVVDERTLRELYLTGFEIAVREGKPRAIMSSYNLLNGEYTNENSHLLQEILRKEWGFGGFVVTDWGGSNDHVAGVRAGSALEMPGPGADSALELVNAVKSGALAEQALDDRLAELLPVVFATVGQKKLDVDLQTHHDLARRCAESSLVLLENDGILPLHGSEKVALIGAFAERPRYQGAGSSQVNPTQLEDLKTRLQRAGVDLEYAPGYRVNSAKNGENLLHQACATAEKAQVVLLCVGLDEISESEGNDRGDLQLPENQRILLEQVTQVNKNVVLVLFGGAPFVLPQCSYRAAIHGYLSGQAGGAAMADALLGKVNPSGKLAETWPLRLEDTPTYGNYPAVNARAVYREGLFVGYRHYDTAGIPVRYPFGHGLSYTKFSYSDLQADAHKVAFTLTNIGDRDGAEIIQVYVSCPKSRISRPEKELKAFKKVFLKAGQSRRVEIVLDQRAFRYFDAFTGNFEVETADYVISVGGNLSATVHVDGIIPNAQPVTVAGEQKKKSGQVTLWTTIGELTQAKSAVARGLARWAHWDRDKRRLRGEPGPSSMYICNMPMRGLGQMSGGWVTREMAEDLVHIANGHFWVGFGRLIKHFFAGWRRRRAFLKKLQ